MFGNSSNYRLKKTLVRRCCVTEPTKRCACDSLRGVVQGRASSSATCGSAPKPQGLGPDLNRFVPARRQSQNSLWRSTFSANLSRVLGIKVSPGGPRFRGQAPIPCLRENLTNSPSSSGVIQNCCRCDAERPIKRTYALTAPCEAERGSLLGTWRMRFYEHQRQQHQSEPSRPTGLTSSTSAISGSHLSALSFEASVQAALRRNRAYFILTTIAAGA